MGTRQNLLTEAVLTSTHNQCLNKNKKSIKKFHLKMNIFTAVKNCCILHGRVCIMIQTGGCLLLHESPAGAFCTTFI